ncbi:unnamed protein product [Oppiella nova]|uniref:Uncharacterized protein n=1 Tax=Oppiella nova TaxID=334625 RepID=A0A7R9LLE2_9ACAR|nr:unnamed protein product [Oppiella nova]CAG2164695.1 unnamed protein product [Oppiella nova]
MKLLKVNHFSCIKNTLIVFLTIKSVFSFLLFITGFTVMSNSRKLPLHKGIVFAYNSKYTADEEINPEDTILAKLSLVDMNTTNVNNKIIGYECMIRGASLFVLYQFGVYGVQVKGVAYLSVLVVLLMGWEVVSYLFLEIYIVFLIADIILIVLIMDLIVLVVLRVKPTVGANEEVDDTSDTDPLDLTDKSYDLTVI